MITDEDLLTLLPGAKVVITDCEGEDHRSDNAGCLCALKGTMQTIGKLYETPFVGTPTWWIEGLDKRARLSELTLIRSPE
jgi:hypothetical protein